MESARIMVSKISLLYVFSDKEASNIFKSIASAQSNSDILITQLKLTRKQYYSRMSRFTSQLSEKTIRQISSYWIWYSNL